jgi:hypothetical protein
MSEVSVNHIIETAGSFQDLANQNGGIFIVGGEENSVRPVGDIRYFSPPDQPEFAPLKKIVTQGAGIVPVRANFDQLAAMPGREFGLLQPGVGIRPAVVTSRSRSAGSSGQAGQLHIAFLRGDRDVIDPNNIAAGANDPLNSVLLQAAAKLFTPTIGAHGSGGAVLSGEIGHIYGGLRTISDPLAKQAAEQGVDVTDSLVLDGKGLAVGITESRSVAGGNVPGAFDMVDSAGKIRRIPYDTATLGPDSTAILIDHPRFNRDTTRLLGGMAPEIATTGLAILAKISRENPVDEARATKIYGQQALGLA